MSGAIADKIAAQVFDDVGAHLGLPTDDAVKGGVGEARQRHAFGIDPLALRLPFRNNRRRQGLRGNDKMAHGRRPQFLAIEQDAVAFLPRLARRRAGIDTGDRRRLIKPPRQRRALALPLAAALLAVRLPHASAPNGAAMACKSSSLELTTRSAPACSSRIGA